MRVPRSPRGSCTFLMTTIRQTRCGDCENDDPLLMAVALAVGGKQGQEDVGCETPLERREEAHPPLLLRCYGLSCQMDGPGGGSVRMMDVFC